MPLRYLDFRYVDTKPGSAYKDTPETKDPQAEVADCLMKHKILNAEIMSGAEEPFLRHSISVKVFHVSIRWTYV